MSCNGCWSFKMWVTWGYWVKNEPRVLDIKSVADSGKGFWNLYTYICNWECWWWWWWWFGYWLKSTLSSFSDRRKEKKKKGCFLFLLVYMYLEISLIWFNWICNLCLCFNILSLYHLSLHVFVILKENPFSLFL